MGALARILRRRAVVVGVVFLLAAIAAMVLAGVIGAALAFGIALGIFGAVTTVVAAVDARLSAGRIQSLVGRGEDAAQEAKDSAREARDAAVESKRAAQEVEAAVETVRVMADDLGATSRAERVHRIKEGVRRVLVSIDLAERRLPDPDPYREPLNLRAIIDLTQPLQHHLQRAGRLYVPSCWRLLLYLVDLLPIDGEELTPRQLKDLRGVALIAWEEIDRPPDEIPLGVRPERGGSGTSENPGSEGPSA